MLAEDSPLKRLPSNLNRRQFSFLVGIRYSIECIDLAHRQLRGALLAMSEHVNGGPAAPADAFTMAVTQAWSMVDSVNRLRVLLENMPGMTKSTPRFQVLIRRLRQFKSLRDPIQHLDTELRSRASADETTAVWGTLRWFLFDEDGNGGQSLMLYPGSLQPFTGAPFVNPAGHRAYDRLDSVTLDAYGASVDLSAVARAVAEFTSVFEEQLAGQFEGHPSGGADLVLAVVMSFTTEATGTD